MLLSKRLRWKILTPTLSLAFSALLSGLQLSSASRDTRSFDFSQIHLLFNLSPVILSWDEWICCRCFCAMKALAKMVQETSGWTFAVKRCRNNIQKVLSKAIPTLFISSGSPSGLVCHQRETLDSPQKHPGGLSLFIGLHGWIVGILRRNITTGKSSSWKDWLALAPCQQHSTRYPQSVLNSDLISRVKTTANYRKLFDMIQDLLSSRLSGKVSPAVSRKGWSWRWLTKWGSARYLHNLNTSSASKCDCHGNH